MATLTDKTVRELAVENLTATRVFEKFGIDYCCGANQSLEQACKKASVSMDEVLDGLEIAEQMARANQSVRDWAHEPLSEVISHVVSTHHLYTRDEVSRLNALLQKVGSVHGKNHPELLEVQSTFAGLGQELLTHMMKEEMVLFPYIVRMEEAVIQNEAILPPPFGRVNNPVAMMEHEHDSAGKALRALRSLTDDYTAPADACVSYQTLYKSLAAFESDLHQHIHLENNILFPRAIEMEEAARQL